MNINEGLNADWLLRYVTQGVNADWWSSRECRGEVQIFKLQRKCCKVLQIHGVNTQLGLGVSATVQCIHR